MLDNEINYNLNEMEKKFGAPITSGFFYFVKCPHCQTIYLFDNEFYVFFVNPNNLKDIIADDNFKCLKCDFVFTANDKFMNGSFYEENQDPKIHVTKQDLLSSDWKWAIT
ncbi:hypothetical protein [Bartonella sp. HY406]|uniref:hypothetical protein n=1 Tax=Bartonella sp. HY406 TaxID=2979331 RepID=UPI0021C6CD41|nr:hypothetical protein [Bartonella sp. HY406]UXN04910.1 hypothetical protein N6B01_14490 [Bartonella sp. HY406]